MSTQTEITRLQTARNTIRTWLVSLGLATSTDKLDDLATKAAGIENQGAVDVNVKEGESYTIPKGYHNGTGTVKGVSGGGNYTLQTKTATPTKSQQSITPDQGYYGLSGVTVGAIPEAYQDTSSVTATAADVLATKVIVTADGKVTTGTMTNNGAASKTLGVATTTYTIPIGYHDGKGVISIVLEEKTVTPTKAAQEIAPSTGKVLSKVTVGAIPDKYVDTTSGTAVAGEILDGKKAWVGGVEVEGTMADNGAIAATIDGLETISYSIAAGYTSGGTVSLTNAIETALAAI